MKVYYLLLLFSRENQLMHISVTLRWGSSCLGFSVFHVLFWKVTLLSFQVTCPSSCATGLTSPLIPNCFHLCHPSSCVYSFCPPLSSLAEYFVCLSCRVQPVVLSPILMRIVRNIKIKACQHRSLTASESSIISRSDNFCKAAASFAVGLVNFTSEGPTHSFCVQLQTGPPLYGVLCPDWIKLAGIPGKSIFSLLHEGEKRHATTVITVGIQTYLTLLNNIKIYHQQQLYISSPRQHSAPSTVTRSQGTKRETLTMEEPPVLHTGLAILHISEVDKCDLTK